MIFLISEIKHKTGKYKPLNINTLNTLTTITTLQQKTKNITGEYKTIQRLLPCHVVACDYYCLKIYLLIERRNTCKFSLSKEFREITTSVC